MQRRNFLQALLAAGSALAGAKAVTAAVALPEPSKAIAPKVAVTADTKPLCRSLDEAQRTVMEMLKECRVRRLERFEHVSQQPSWRVTYEHSPDAPRTSLDDEADEIHETRVPKCVTVMNSADDIDGLMAGYGWDLLDTTKRTCEIEVVWL